MFLKWDEIQKEPFYSISMYYLLLIKFMFSKKATKNLHWQFDINLVSVESTFKTL